MVPVCSSQWGRLYRYRLFMSMVDCYGGLNRFGYGLIDSCIRFWCWGTNQGWERVGERFKSMGKRDRADTSLEKQGNRILENGQGCGGTQSYFQTERPQVAGGFEAVNPLKVIL